MIDTMMCDTGGESSPPFLLRKCIVCKAVKRKCIPCVIFYRNILKNPFKYGNSL